MPAPGKCSPTHNLIAYPAPGGEGGESPLSPTPFSFQPDQPRNSVHSSLPVMASFWPPARFMVLAMLLLMIYSACTSRNQSLDRIRTTGVLRIAMDPSFTPFEYIDDENNLVGYDVDLALEIADGLGVEAQFVTTGYDALYDALTVGRADIIISALYPDPSRTHAFVYSASYFNGGDVLLVPNDSSISGWESLGGKRVACLYGTAAHLTALEWQNTITPQPMIITTQTTHTLTNALVSGELDAVILDHVTALITAENSTALHILSTMITEEPYVIASRQEDQTLIKAIDDLLAHMHHDGSLQRLTQKWMH